MKNVVEMSNNEILEEYNSLTGKNIKRFESRVTAIARLLDARNPMKDPKCPSCGATKAQSLTSDNSFLCQKCSCEYSNVDSKILQPGQKEDAEMKHPRKTRAAKPAAAKKVRKTKTNGGADRSAAVAESWKNKAVHAARSTHHSVRVGGTEYGSVKKAFEALKLPLGQHIAFRGKLKKEGAMTFEHGDKKFNFKLVAKD